MPNLLQITAKHFVAGAEMDETYRVVDAAPIIKHTIGWTYEKVIGYCFRKGWEITLNGEKI